MLSAVGILVLIFVQTRVGEVLSFALAAKLPPQKNWSYVQSRSSQSVRLSPSLSFRSLHAGPNSPGKNPNCLNLEHWVLSLSEVLVQSISSTSIPLKSEEPGPIVSRTV